MSQALLPLQLILLAIVYIIKQLNESDFLFSIATYKIAWVLTYVHNYCVAIANN